MRKQAKVNVAPVVNRKATKADIERDVQYKLDRYVEQAAEAREEIAKKLAAGDLLEYLIRWKAEDAIRYEYIATWALLIKGRPEHFTLMAALKEVVGQRRRELIHNYMRSNSTSVFSNAVEGETKRAAAAQFVSEFEVLIQLYDEAEV